MERDRQRLRLTSGSGSSDGSTWTNIAGATAATYTLGVADEGDVVRVVVTATNPDAGVSAVSAATATVPASPPNSSALPAITGTAQRASTLTTTTGAWGGLGNTYAIQWQHSTGSGYTNIAGATAATYALGSADESSTLRVVVTATNADGVVSATSAPTATVSAAPPVNTTPPSVTGIAQRTGLLSASPGVWGGIGNAYAYQWQRSGDGSTWASIAGATASTYTARSGRRGRRAPRARDASPTPTAPWPSPAPRPPPCRIRRRSTAPCRPSPAPRNARARSRRHRAPGAAWPTRTPTSGSTRSTAARRGPAINGASTTVYTLGRSDEGSIVRVAVTATNADGAVTATSAPTATVAATPPVNTTPPSLTGTAQRTGTLAAGPGVWSGVGNAYAYQWQRSTDGGVTWTAIGGATTTAYTLGVADEGTRLRIVVTATNPDGSVSVASAASATVIAAPPVNTSVPTVSGVAQRTATLTATVGAWNGFGNAYTYQWQRSGDGGNAWTAVTGATGTTYTLGQSDEGLNVRVVVAATNPDGTTTAASAATSPVQAAPPVNTSPPAVNGPARLGATLTALTGAWTPATPGFAYQWQSSADGGTTWTGIIGATAPTYTVAQSDVGTIIRVVVTATNIDGTTSVASQASATVAQPPRNTVAPAAPSGTLMDSYTLTADPGSWDTPGVTFAYAWQRCPAAATTISASCTQIASGPTYVLTAADVGSTVAVSVTATSAGGSTTASGALDRDRRRAPADERLAAEHQRNPAGGPDPRRQPGYVERPDLERHLHLGALRRGRCVQLRAGGVRSAVRGRRRRPRPHDRPLGERDLPGSQRERAESRAHHPGTAGAAEHIRPDHRRRRAANRDAVGVAGDLDQRPVAVLPVAALRLGGTQLPEHRRRHRHHVRAREGRRGLHHDRARDGDERQRLERGECAADRGRGRHPAGQHPPAGRQGAGIGHPAGHAGVDRRRRLERDRRHDLQLGHRTL